MRGYTNGKHRPHDMNPPLTIGDTSASSERKEGTMSRPASIQSKHVRRDQATEALRIVACYGIVAYHSHASFHDFAYSGLIVFLFLSPFVDCFYNWEKSRSALSLARIYLIPWGFWMGIYGLLNVLVHKPVFPTDSWITGLLYGTSPHLWFLPAMFAVLSIVNVLKTAVDPVKIYWAAVVAATLLLATVGSWQSLMTNWSPPFAQWIHAAPAVLVGTAVGLQGRIMTGKVASLSILGLALGVAAAARLPGISIPYLVGLVGAVFVVFLGARFWPARWSVQTVASCTLGIYVSHIFWLGLIGRITGRENHVTVLGAFLVALLTIWLVRRYLPASRLVVG